MFRLMFGGGKGQTSRPVKNHNPGSKREQFSNFTLKTLGTGDISGNLCCLLQFQNFKKLTVL
jgi:hypothetical protein